MALPTGIRRISQMSAPKVGYGKQRWKQANVARAECARDGIMNEEEIDRASEGSR